MTNLFFLIALVSTENKEAACKVETSFDNFLALTKGDLNPMNAVMSGKGRGRK